MFFAYVVKNQNNGKIYVGHTINLEDRLKRHNHLLPNKSKSYTSKNRGRWLLVYKEWFTTRKEAIVREKQLKSFRGREFIKKLTMPP